MMPSSYNQRKKLEEQLLKLIKAGLFYEADKLNLLTPIIDSNTYNALKAPYVERHIVHLLPILEKSLVKFDFEEADYIYYQNDHIFSESDYIFLKKQYLAKQLRPNLNIPLIGSNTYSEWKRYYVGPHLIKVIEDNLAKFDFKEADYIYYHTKRIFNESRYISLKIKYLRKQLKIKLTDRFMNSNFAEAEQLYLSEKDLISKEDYEKLKLNYAQPFIDKQLPYIKAHLSNYEFDKADKIYQKYREVFPTGVYEELRHSYLVNQFKTQLCELLEEEEFAAAAEFFHLSEKGLMSREDYEKLKLNYTQPIIDKQLPCIKAYLAKYAFDEADSIFQKYREVFQEGFYEKLRHKYLVEQFKKQLCELLQKEKFSAADRFFNKGNPIISRAAYKEIKDHYLRIFQENIMVKLEKMLTDFKFSKADALYSKNKEILPILTTYYEQLRNKNLSKYLIFNMDQLLQRKKFVECHQLYEANCQLPLKAEYEQLRAKYIKQHLQAIEAKLSTEQCEAISKIATNTLVMARAGSGKTTTIACKAIHLLKNEEQHPDQVLLLAFNNKACNEMRERLEHKYGINPMPPVLTFHKLAFGIVRPKQTLLLDDIGEFSIKKRSQFVQNIIKDTWDDEFKSALYSYFRREVEEFEEVQQHDRGFVDEDYLIFRRDQPQTTLMGEQVKSQGEKFIADFLFEHGIQYSYEKAILWNNERYQPDFTIDAFKNRIVLLEHWGIDENDYRQKVPKHWRTSWKQYCAQMQEKRRFCREQKILLLETSIVDLRNGRESFEAILKERLCRAGIQCIKLSQAELLWRVIDNQIAQITKMFIQFIQKAKQGMLTPENINKKIKNKSKNERITIFMRLANFIYEQYEKKLKATNQIDFNYLILMAINHIYNSESSCTLTVGNRQYLLADFHRILIDEYQDFSKLFYQLVDAIRSITPEVKLFCVGDDWQAINGFAGSDLKYFKKFTRIFADSDIAKLKKNYRNGENILNYGNSLMIEAGTPCECVAENMGLGQVIVEDVSNVRIELHKNHDGKKSEDDKFIFRNVKGQFFDENYIKARYLKQCCKIIAANPGKTVAILNRTNQFFGLDLGYFYKKVKECLHEMGFKMVGDNLVVTTVHDFKGRETEVVIILQTCVGRFPLVHPDYSLYEAFGQTRQHILDEEKRLFYVALSRAKSQLYLLTEKGSESEYLSQIDTKALNFLTSRPRISRCMISKNDLPF